MTNQHRAFYKIDGTETRLKSGDTFANDWTFGAVTDDGETIIATRPDGHKDVFKPEALNIVVHKHVGTVDITPTWRGILPLLVEVANTGTTLAGRQEAWKSLYELADFADKINAERKAVEP